MAEVFATTPTLQHLTQPEGAKNYRKGARERGDTREGEMKREAKHVRRRDDSLFVPNYTCMYLCTFAPCVKTFQGENMFLQICVRVVPPVCTVCARPHLQARDAMNTIMQPCHGIVHMQMYECMFSFACVQLDVSKR